MIRRKAKGIMVNIDRILVPVKHYYIHSLGVLRASIHDQSLDKWQVQFSKLRKFEHDNRWIYKEAILERQKRCYQNEQLKVPLWSKSSPHFFLQILKACLFDTLLAKSWASNFIQRLFSLSASLGFHGPPLFTFKTDRLDFRGLDRG